MSISVPFKLIPVMVALSLIALIPGAASAQTTVTGNSADSHIIANGGFETGSFSISNDWYPERNVQISTTDPHSGAYDAEFTGGFGRINEGNFHPLNTTVGQLYTLNFFLSASSTATGSFIYDYGDQSNIQTVPVLYTPGAGYQQFTASYLATSSRGYVDFTADPDPGNGPISTGQFFVDDVSLTPATASAAPEPSAWVSILFTALGIGGLTLRARKSRKRAA